MIFEGIDAAHYAILQYAVSWGFSYKVIKSENGQFIAYYCLEVRKEPILQALSRIWAILMDKFYTHHTRVFL
jgi:hypothetical protein